MIDTQTHKAMTHTNKNLQAVADAWTDEMEIRNLRKLVNKSAELNSELLEALKDIRYKIRNQIDVISSSDLDNLFIEMESISNQAIKKAEG